MLFIHSYRPYCVSQVSAYLSFEAIVWLTFREYMVKKSHRYLWITEMLSRVVLSSIVQISKCMNAQVSTSWVYIWPIFVYALLTPNAGDLRYAVFETGCAALSFSVGYSNT
jgi:hypothetical protein